MERHSAVLKRIGAEARDAVVDTSPFCIGRSAQAKIVIMDLNISRQHCRLVYDKSHKHWKLEDTSASGTFVNEKLVGKGKSVQIHNLDKIRIGAVDCKLSWIFRITPKSILKYAINSQSKTIVDICTQKNVLSTQAAQYRENSEKMKIEKGKIERQCLRQVKALDDRLASQSNQSPEVQALIKAEVEKEKKKIQTDMEMKVLKLQTKITENHTAEENLKSEIKKLQSQLASEKHKWENKFYTEKGRLEQQIEEQNKKMLAEKEKLNSRNQACEKMYENKLKEQEKEKTMLKQKLEELEQTKKRLSEKLKESDEMHKVELMKIKKNEMDSAGAARSNELLKELSEVKTSLKQTETERKTLEEELAQASSKHSDVSNVLQNIAGLMENELQCSICSEIFVTPVTLKCSHTFCMFCLEMWKKKKKNCPVCRMTISGESRVLVIDNYIDRMVETLPEEFKSRRKAIIAERSETPIPAKKSRKTMSTPNGRVSNRR